jgi:DNA polymerase-1
LRIFASFAQEVDLIEAIRKADAGEGPDLHTYAAQVVYNDESITKKDPRRNLAKNTAFCTIYGGGASKIAETAGVTVDEAKGFLDVYMDAFPGIRRFQRQVEQVVKQRIRDDGVGFVNDPFGRYHPLLEDEGAYKAANYLIQGSAASVLKERMISLSNAGLAEFMVLPVHDEVVFDIPDDLVDDALPVIKDAMEDLTTFAVPLRVSVSEPQLRWGACK